jgi:hypothetical protein
MTNRRLALSLAAAALGMAAPLAQMTAPPEQAGRIGLGLMLRRLANTGIFLETTAHPDDENSSLHALLNRGLGARTALATATRGAGGQNEIGPELSEALAVLRTEELAAVHRWDGAEQYFARAIDFGYSFSLEETFEKWGRNRIKEGLGPWQPKKLYYSVGCGQGVGAVGARTVAVDSDVYDSLLGQTCAEIGSAARSSRKCQGMGQLLALPGPSVRQYRLSATTMPRQAEKTETSLFDGIGTTIAGLAKFVGGAPPEPLRTGLAAVAREVELAQRAFEALRAKEHEFERAILLAHGLRVDVLADDGLVVGGQPIRVSIIVANRGRTGIDIRRVGVDGFDGDAGCKPDRVAASSVYRCDASLHVPADAQLTRPYWKPLPDAARYEYEPDVAFGAPFRPTPFQAAIDLESAGAAVALTTPV